jgi:hypothetical protein
MQQLGSLFAYIGPETILPATSALAAIGGIVLAFGRSATRPLVAGFFWLIGKKSSVTSVPDSGVEQAPAAPASTEQS